MVVTYDYTDRNWVKEIKIDNVIQGADLKEFKENYLYDPVGNLDFLEEREGIVAQAPSVYKKTDFSYDNLNRLVEALPVNTGQSDPWNNVGRYADRLQFAYDKVGNIKSNYELTYCYLQSGGTDSCGVFPCACGSSIGNVENNRLMRVYAYGSGPYDANDIATEYTYDTYGNMQTENTWQELPVGAVKYVSTPAGIAVIGGGLENLADGTTVRVVYYHDQNALMGTSERYAWETTSSAYTACDVGSYWDLNSENCFKKKVVLTSTTELTGTDAPADFYDDNTYPDTPTAVPFIKQYFRVYVNKGTKYCWDYANRLTSWYAPASGTRTSCMKFAYDHAGNRIQKIEWQLTSPTTSAKRTNYITQGVNVIYEDVVEDATFTCLDNAAQVPAC
jgi:hypothetical protein